MWGIDGWVFALALGVYGVFAFALLQGWVDRAVLFVHIFVQSHDLRTAIEQSAPEWIPTGKPESTDWQWNLDPRFQKERDQRHTTRVLDWQC